MNKERLIRSSKIGVIVLLLSIPFIPAFPQTNHHDIDEARKVYAEGLRLEEEATPGSLRSAVEKYEEALGLYRNAGKKEEEAIATFRLAYVKKELKLFEAARIEFKKALILFRDLKIRKGETSSLSNLAGIAISLGETQTAESILKELIKVCRDSKDAIGEGFFNIELGELYAKGNVDQAIVHFREAVRIFRVTDDILMEGYSVQMLGDLYFGSNNYEKAKDLYEQLLQLSRRTTGKFSQLDKKRNEGQALQKLGDAHKALGQNKKAREYFESALALAVDIQDKPGEWAVLSRLGLLPGAVLSREEALEYMRRALEVSRKLKNPSLEAYSLSNLGLQHWMMGKTEQAIPFYEQSLLTARNSKENKVVEQSSLERLGEIYLDLNLFDKALPYFESALVVARELKDSVRECKILIHLAQTEYGRKNFEKIYQYYSRAVEVARSTNNREGEVEALTFLGQFYLAVSQYEKASQAFERTLKLAIEINDRSSEAVALSGLGDVNNATKKFDDALALHKKVLSIAREVDDKLLETFAHIGIGVALKNTGARTKAQNSFETAVKMSRELRALFHESRASNELAIMLSEAGDLEKARILSERSLLLARQMGEAETESYALINLMNVWGAMGKPEVSTLYGKQLINIIQTARTRFKSLDADLQRTFMQDKERYYRALSDQLINEGRLFEAQQVLDLLKGEEYKEITRQRAGEEIGSVPYSSAENQSLKYVDNLAELESQRSILVSKRIKGVLSKDEEKLLSQVQIQIDEVNRAFRLSLEALAKSEVSVEGRVKEVQKEKNLQRIIAQLQAETDSGVAAIYTILGGGVAKNSSKKGSNKDKFGWIILVTPNSRKAYPIDTDDLERVVFDLRAALSSDQYDPRPSAEKLYTKLFRQRSPKQKNTLEDDLTALLRDSTNRTLMWSLDGILRYIPMASLHDGQGYLVEKYSNIVFTGESLSTLAQRDAQEWTGLGMGVSEQRESLTALPGVERELRDIVRTENAGPGILDGVIKLNQEFTEEASLQLWRDGSFPLIHIASHYKYNVADPQSSFLLMGDGKLTFAELQDKDNIFGKVDLLTLSACDTAMGSGNGKEAEGFAYLAQTLGAKSVIASLWQISDSGTPEFMLRFYRSRVENPTLPKGRSFRSAQLSMLYGNQETVPAKGNRSDPVNLESPNENLHSFVKNPDAPFSHPYYWAPFILIGNWR